MSQIHCHCSCCTPDTGKGVGLQIGSLSVKAGRVSILQDISLSIPPSSCTAIIGPNGAGKTTLVRAILGDMPHTGRITYSKEGKTSGNPRIGYVPQKLQFDREMPLLVMEFLSSNLTRRPLFFGVSKVFRERAMEFLEEVDCAHSADRKLGALSGGELQRVLLALALMRDPELLILDEPAAGVDFKGEALFCELLEKFRKKMGFTLLMVSHDLSTVAAHASHVVCLNKKVIAQGSPKEVLKGETLMETFGLHMGLIHLDEQKFGKGKCTCSSSQQ